MPVAAPWHGVSSTATRSFCRCNAHHPPAELKPGREGRRLRARSRNAWRTTTASPKPTASSTTPVAVPARAQRRPPAGPTVRPHAPHRSSGPHLRRRARGRSPTNPRSASADGAAAGRSDQSASSRWSRASRPDPARGPLARAERRPGRRRRPGDVGAAVPQSRAGARSRALGAWSTHGARESLRALRSGHRQDLTDEEIGMAAAAPDDPDDDLLQERRAALAGAMEKLPERRRTLIAALLAVPAELRRRGDPLGCRSAASADPGRCVEGLREMLAPVDGEPGSATRPSSTPTPDPPRPAPRRSASASGAAWRWLLARPRFVKSVRSIRAATRPSSARRAGVAAVSRPPGPRHPLRRRVLPRCSSGAR